jgi:hypothetical protein
MQSRSIPMKTLAWIAALLALVGASAAAADDDRGPGERDAHRPQVWLGPQSLPPPPCGGLGLIEGYGTPASAKRIAGMIKAAGGEIKYLVMDEPLYYGHFSTAALTGVTRLPKIQNDDNADSKRSES